MDSPLVEEEGRGSQKVEIPGEEQSVRIGEEGVERKGRTALPRHAGCVGSRSPTHPTPASHCSSLLWSLAIPSSHHCVLSVARCLELSCLVCVLSVGQG